MQKKYEIVLVTNKNNTSNHSYLGFIDNCISLGLSSILLREKSLNPTDLLNFSKQVRILTKKRGIKLIINDSIELAHKIGADGVHLGQTDGCPYEARLILGEKAIIGQSINNLTELQYANNTPCLNYVNIMAIFKSLTKENISSIWGIDGLKIAIKNSRHNVMVSGGINLANINSVINTGINSIAISSALHDSKQAKAIIQSKSSIFLNTA